ncbi:putative aldouronate transport system permease protein [Paenibacillus sp. V4I3]|uniref:ABC transporter permease n=1 Tax=unclassified Paenibacillus TaxID=185978 RepID=UPI00278A85FB|nr:MULTISPECIES: ABC transporter permease subunit [unclassified Paenibacillus]MDQ0874782.1 putative aldouronate transport system permease protein [Paenibacillus sp. V4I3]MDQ0889466.1 putative aldouronate transport system permease protein [Paenibacillus sp. V4I9]
MAETTTAFKEKPTAKRPVRQGKLRSIYHSRWFYLMMIPGLVYYILFHYAPMVGTLIAFQNYNLMKGIWGSPWVGFDNFRVIFDNPEFLQIMRNTLLISVYKIVGNMVPDVILALMLNEVRVLWFKRAVQTITYGPYFLSWVIVYGLAFSFLAPGSGLISTFVRDMGWGQIDLLTNKDFFRPMLVLSEIWKNTGFGAIIYLAALASINQELYEAAVVDGAGRWRQLWHITLPGIRDVFVLLLIIRIGGILDAGFDQVFIFLNARVYDVGDIVDTWVYRYGFERLEFGVAAAMGVFKSLVGLILVIGANKLAKKVGGSGIW